MITADVKLLNILDSNLTFNRLEFIMNIPIDLCDADMNRLIDLYDRAVMYRYEYVQTTLYDRIKAIVRLLI